MCEHNRERIRCKQAARACASTTAKGGGANNAAARASVSTTAKGADYCAIWTKLSFCFGGLITLFQLFHTPCKVRKLSSQATQREQVQGLPAEGGLVLPLHTQAQTDTQAQAQAHTKPHNNTLEPMEPFLNKIKSCQIANGIFGEQMSLQCSALSYLWLKRCAAVRVILHREQCIAAAPLEAYTSGLGRRKLARHPD
jgi:hypothetical protein